MKDWLSNIKVLWSIIIALGGALTGFIIYNQTLMSKIDRTMGDLIKVRNVIDVIENSYLYQNKLWKLEIETALVHAGIISFDAGILKIKGE